MFGFNKAQMVSAENAMPGRNAKMLVPDAHFINGNPLQGPFPEHLEQAVFGWAASGVLNACFGS